MISRSQLETDWTAWEKEVKELEPHSLERRKSVAKIADLWAELAHISQRIENSPAPKDHAQRYLGLDPLKISALNLAQNIEGDEVNFLTLYFQYTHELILSNILKLRTSPGSSSKLQSFFTPLEVSGFSKALLVLEHEEQERWADRTRIQREIEMLREDYELFLFAESSYEAARSFHAPPVANPNERSSWAAFSQLLTGVALQVHDEKKSILIKRSRRIEVQRVSLYESCATLLAKSAKEKGAKKIQRQLMANFTALKKLENEIETTLTELSIPTLNDPASFVVKKSPGEATTFQPTKISQRTGDKT